MPGKGGRPPIDLTGQKFDLWTAIEYVTPRGWLCRCECGAEEVLHTWGLRHSRFPACFKC